MFIHLLFAGSISEVYRKKLQTFSNTILAQGLTENRPPIIEFPGMNRETFSKIYDLRHAYDRRY